ncbi:helix-turn-helix domain-containing protein [Alicyclobacillus macrosporangiidus]|uniref:helix-turn-helix domain-containing protein n=1 Tax=Alicyclobacillus macrosporangiidus TaxID=392015 RepID=UPI00158785A2|nr:helix-turn-helix transcriptional regulator [Alicyclobacillus macrosporangiidus]
MVKVREVRQQRGITTYELAKRSGLAQSFVWKLDHGKIKSPSINTLTKLAKALDCSVDDLYEEEEAKRA